jgi:hypothetical protein
MDGRIAADALEQRVLTFTSIHAGVDLRKLTPMTRLAQDIDIKGDDASRFFDEFAKDFRVNLGELNVHWDQHFHPEAGLFLNTIFWVVGCVALAFFLLHPIYMYYWASSNEWWVGSGITGVLSLFAWWFQNRKAIPITIADLIDAAQAGRWVKAYK